MARRWFQLVGEDGNDVTSADAVMVEIADVVALRDAVKEKLKDSHLAGIAASDLTVFANRAAYDAFRAAYDAKKQSSKASSSLTDVGKGAVTGALAGDTLIGSLGSSMEDALIVQVPTYRQSGIVRKERELEEEKEGKRKRTYSRQLDEVLEIVEQFKNAKNRVVGTLLSTSNSIFATALGNGIYIRQEYRDLYCMIKKKLSSDESISRFLVVGSPGIGKSVFGVLLLVDFMRKGKNVAYRPLGSLVTYYFTWNSVSGYEISDMPHHGMQYHGFFDGTEAKGALVFSDFHYVFLFASPPTKNYNNFVKDNCFVVYMNPWTKDECQRFANVINLKDQDEWVRRFNLVGGKPRFLFSFSHTYDDLVARVKADIPNTVADLKDQVRLFQQNVLKKEMKHIVFNIYRDEKFPSQSYLAYSSLIVETMIGARYDIESADAIRSLLQTPAPNLQSWRGKQLEKFLLQDLATNKFCTRSLEGSDVGTVSQHGPFLAKSKVISALSDIECELVLYIPLSKTFPALDSVLVVPSDRRIMYVQSTVSTNHPIKYTYVKEAYEHLALRQEFQGYTHRLLFIVPDDTYDKFTVQPYQNMDGKTRKTSIDVDVTQYVGKIIRQ